MAENGHGSNGSGRRALGWILTLCGGLMLAAFGWLVHDHTELKQEYEEHAGRSVELIEMLKRNDIEQRTIMDRLKSLEIEVAALRREMDRR